MCGRIRFIYNRVCLVVASNRICAAGSNGLCLNNWRIKILTGLYRRAFWRKIRAWLTGTSNELLPYDEVRQQLPFSGQRDLGVQTIPVG